jgi:predicted nucleic acid-binding protein
VRSGTPTSATTCSTRRSLAVFERYDDQALSFTDATTAALLERHAVDGVLSFDDDFDGVVQRFDPGDV